LAKNVNERGNVPADPMEQNATQHPDRRQFWRDLLGEAVVVAEEMCGIGHHSMREIPNLPDSILAEIVPVWREGVNVEIREDGIYRSESKGEAIRIHQFEGYEKMIADQFACGRNLKTIAGHVASASGLDTDSVFKMTKDLFIGLCQCRCCHPAASHT
jgi:hypothetical protein